jgi:hypothetical protein
VVLFYFKEDAGGEEGVTSCLMGVSLAFDVEFVSDVL